MFYRYFGISNRMKIYMAPALQSYHSGGYANLWSTAEEQQRGQQQKKKKTFIRNFHYSLLSLRLGQPISSSNDEEDRLAVKKPAKWGLYFIFKRFGPGLHRIFVLSPIFISFNPCMSTSFMVNYVGPFSTRDIWEDLSGHFLIKKSDFIGFDWVIHCYIEVKRMRRKEMRRGQIKKY